MAYPGGMQLGGGVTADNAAMYLGAGASHVIVTSWVVREGRLDRQRLAELVRPARGAPAAAWRRRMSRAGAPGRSRPGARQCEGRAARAEGALGL